MGYGNLCIKKSKLPFLFLLIIEIASVMFGFFNDRLAAVLVLVLNVILAKKTSKNLQLYFISVFMLYSNASVIFSKYLGEGTSTLRLIYNQVKYQDTMSIGIYSILIFTTVILLVLNPIEKNKTNIYIPSINIKTSNNLSYIFSAGIVLIIIGYLKFHLFGRTIYEYALLIFVFGFYFSNKNILSEIILLVFLFISLCINMYEGGRIITLQPLLAYLFLRYSEKISVKLFNIVLILGIILFTFAGIYGDYVQFGLDFSNVTLSSIMNTVMDRKFTLDTSISSYWTGLTYIEIANNYSVFYRLSNFFSYLVIYTIFGTKSGYTQLYDLSRQYYTHYYGGYITSYFYFWLGWLGVIIIGLVIGLLFNYVSSAQKGSSDFKKLFSVYFTASFLRWYLYYPTALVRGVFIFSIVYLLTLFFIKKNKH